MASVIDTATADPGTAASKPPLAPPAPIADDVPRASGRQVQTVAPAAIRRLALAWWPGWRRLRWPKLSPLTRRIVAVNVLPLALLAVGFLYLGKFEASLIGQEIESLLTQGQIFAAALSEGAVLDSADEGEVLLPDLARQMMRRLVEPTHSRARLFGVDGKLIADSRMLLGSGDPVQVADLPEPNNKGLFARVTDDVYDWIANLVPSRHKYPVYKDATNAQDYREVTSAMHGDAMSVVRSNPNTGGLVISVAVPLHRYKQNLGAMMLSNSNGEIEDELRTVRLELIRIFGATLLVTLLLSLYLAGTIARPIRLLAAAAQRARGRGSRIEIPEISRRGDEIGELADSLREMTDTLWRRMSAIESFAADVAHEIKNPLSSLRSAVETTSRIDDPVKQRKLMAIVQDDVERLDRLITDISDASRLDAELSRVEMSPIDIGAMLGALVEMHDATRDANSPRLILEQRGRDRDLAVMGMESRLSQVFLNVIANAVSFSPPDGEIRITATKDGRAVLVTVEDQGPGIPSDKVSAIFDRFYSERPAGEKFGTHSGLGLSISKQIVEAHRGRIWAENRTDTAGKVGGARFLIRLPGVP